MSEGYWDKEEFEDLVATGLIAMYESQFKKNKWAEKYTRLNPKIIAGIRKIGCYFPPDDRVAVIDENKNGLASRIQHLDIINEGRPEKAVFSMTGFDQEYYNGDSMRKGCYFENTYIERIHSYPKGLFCDTDGKKYRLTKLWLYQDAIAEGFNWYFVIDHNGKIDETYKIRNYCDKITGRYLTEKVSDSIAQKEAGNDKAECGVTLDAHIAIQYWQDRRFLWNVTAKEGIAKATFGVHPEQIKSLFYARELPMTETGRKRPILHWVNAHQRRLKKGIDIDIEKYLRGINEFVYQGTKFIITRPMKGIAK